MRNRLALSVFLTALTALAVWFMWPIYEDVYMFVSVGLGLAVGFAISWWQSVRKLSPLATTLIVLSAFVLLALPATNPRALSNPSLLVSGWVESLVSPVTAWKQLVTVDLPVGTYHALLAPAFLSFLIAGAVFGWVMFGPITRYWAVAYPVLVLIVVAIGFGATSVPGDFNLFGLAAAIPTPLVSGSMLFALMVVYLNWGSRAARRSTLVASTASDVPLLSGWQRKLRRNLAGIVVVAIALLSTGIFMQNTGLTATRIVLRSDIEKLKDIQKQTSPLSTYRKYFNDSKLYGTTLLTFSTAGAPSRIRIATMPFYDGDNFTVAPTKPTGGNDSYYFARVPSDLPPTNSGPSKSFTLTVGKLDSIWLPLTEGVRKVDFSGVNALKLSDALFVNRETDTGAIIPGPSSGSNYTITYNQPETVDPGSIKASSSAIDATLIPESLNTWLDNHADIVADTGTGIVQLAKLLRDRGYLSHSFVEPKATDGGATWADSLNNYTFFQSNAGHNLARISTMFSEINTREQDAKSRESKNLVSTAGDDEQFATAIALIASAKGFPARVVIGFRTSQTDDVPGVDPCSTTGTQGICKGGNLAAWAEIRGTNGKWLAIDATPQFAKQMNLIPVGTAYVPNPTKSGEDDATALPPAKATPSSDSECRKHPNSPDCNPDDFWQKFMGFLTNYVAPVLVTLLVLGIFAAPFAFVVLTKRNRRRSRLSAQEPETKVIGAWEEYIDLLVDHGAELPGSQTRKELAELYATTSISELANLADLAAFSPRMPNQVEIERSWEIVRIKEEEFDSSSKLFQKIRSQLSLRSFLRNLNPKQEMLRLRNSFNFVQGNKASDGSALEGLTIEFKRQLKAVFAKKSK